MSAELQAIAAEAQRRRTFAIISHPDAGKTTLTEKLLLFGGAIQAAGTVKAKKSGRHATSDWMEIEKQRGISVASSVMQFEYGDHVVNLLDTPGHQDFSEDTYRVLSAVDSALMVIDGAKGVEPQTIKLLEVCRLRTTPILTFINKLDREVRDPFDLLDEVESVLKITCAPITWPIGMGKTFRGVYHLANQTVALFKAGEGKDPEIVHGLDHPSLAGFSQEIAKLKEDLELLAAANTFDQEAFLNGTLTPVFFGSAINNFGVREILDALVAEAPAPMPRHTPERMVGADEGKFSGFIFKIQANMDPAHRDRVAFLRVCSGHFERGMKLWQVRTGKEIRATQVVAFLSQRRETIEDAWPGDIIGLFNHGSIQIGDSFTEGETLHYTGIPYFAPEMFRAARPKNPSKMKQFHKGLEQLGEEGAIQVFKPESGYEVILGAVGVLQFEVVAHRLATEYGVEVLLEPKSLYGARWVTCDHPEELARFERENGANLAQDASGSMAYLAPTRVNLELTQERFPLIQFHTTRELTVTLGADA